MTATLASTVTVPKDVLFRDLGGEAIVLNPIAGKYYGLDVIGTRMWSLLNEYGQIEPVYRVLLDEYEVVAGQLQGDLLSFVEQLAAEQLLDVDEA